MNPTKFILCFVKVTNVYVVNLWINISGNNLKELLIRVSWLKGDITLMFSHQPEKCIYIIYCFCLVKLSGANTLISFWFVTG